MKNLLATLVFIFLTSYCSIAQLYEVSNTTKTLRDIDRRNRNVRTRIYYPNVNESIPLQGEETTFPVIVLGHGFIMGANAYQNIYNTLVPQGYIVAFVDTEGSFFANHDAYSKDLAFVVDAIQEENNDQNSPLFGIVDSKTALMGHSMGGGAATVAASLTQVETVITFAPATLRFDTLTPASQVSTDAIVFSGSEDGVTPPSEEHLPIYDNLGSGCKYFISITGGAHCYYANSHFACDFGENSSSGNVSVSRVEQHDIMFRFLNSWLEYKLKGNTSAELTFTDDLESSNDITFQNGCTSGLSTFQKLEKDKIVKLLPNPATSEVSIITDTKSGLVKVEFYNQSGKLISTSTDKVNTLSGFEPGHYLVKVYTNNQIVTKLMYVK